MTKSTLLAATAGILLSTIAANATPILLPILGGHGSTPQTILPGNPVAAVVASAAGIVQVVFDPLASQSGTSGTGILSPLVSLNESDAANIFTVVTGNADPLHPDPSKIFAIDPNVQLGADVSTLALITGSLLTPGADPNPLLLVTDVTHITADLDLSGLGLIPDVSVGINPLDLCLSLAVGGNATACPSSIDTGPVSQVPEPSSLAILGAGIASLLGFRRRNKSIL